MRILITGAAGFIASRLADSLSGRDEVVLYLVDDFEQIEKKSNWQGLDYADKIDRDIFLEQIKNEKFPYQLDWIIHLGARTDTTEMDYKIHEELNLEYSKEIWKYCTSQQISLVYASSAATYGDGNMGYVDDLDLAQNLKPLNPYGVSKNEFDKWVAEQSETPPHWYGLKFFNVYGPNESHKGRMASVVYHAYNQINENGEVKLFRSHNPEYSDGEQLRDFVYVDDVVGVIEWLMAATPRSDIYNLGTGQARTFLDLVRAVFDSLGKEENIAWMDTPEDIRDKYQYFTEANMNKLREQGYTSDFTSLEDGIRQYVDYLKTQD